MATETKKLHELVADKIIEQLKEGIAPWQKPWNSSGTDYKAPYNAVTNKAYQGLNALYLNLFSPFDDPRWATFKQAEGQGWQIQKGAKGFMINFVKTHELKQKLDENKKPVQDISGKPVKIQIELKFPIVQKAWVFNAEQIKGIGPQPIVNEEKNSLWEKLIRAENIFKACGAKIDHVPGDAAFYTPLHDKIQMPKRNQFESSDRYYSTLLHELGHWTSHPSRLDRELINKFGTPDYAREELRAEIASMILGNELKIGHDPKQHIAYVDSWIKVLTDTPYEIHAAAADAQRIYDYVIGLEQKQELSIERAGDKTLGSNSLIAGQKINYGPDTYEVLKADEQNFLVINLQNLHKIQLTAKDGLFKSLITASSEQELVAEQTSTNIISKNLNSISTESKITPVKSTNLYRQP